MNYEVLSIDRLEEHEKLIKENGLLREERNELERELQDANESITWWNNRYNAINRCYNSTKNIIDDLTEHIIEAKKNIQELIDMTSEDNKILIQRLEFIKSYLEEEV